MKITLDGLVIEQDNDDERVHRGEICLERQEAGNLIISIDGKRVFKGVGINDYLVAIEALSKCI